MAFPANLVLLHCGPLFPVWHAHRRFHHDNILDALVHVLQGYQLSEYETMVFVPCLVEKAGHNQVCHRAN